MLPTQLVEERLIRQQQEMEEDQRWLEKEERFLVILVIGTPSACDALARSAVLQTIGKVHPFQNQRVCLTSGP